MLQFYHSLFLFLLLLAVALGLAAALRSATLRDTVRDARTGEVLIGAIVVIPTTQ